MSKIMIKNIKNALKKGIRISHFSFLLTYLALGKYIFESIKTEPDKRIYQQVFSSPRLKLKNKEIAKALNTSRSLIYDFLHSPNKHERVEGWNMYFRIFSPHTGTRNTNKNPDIKRKVIPKFKVRACHLLARKLLAYSSNVWFCPRLHMF